MLIRGANSSSHPTKVSSVRLYTLPYTLQIGLVHWSFNQPCCMHANMHCTDSSQVGGGGCWVGSHIGSHDKMHIRTCKAYVLLCIVCTCIVYDGPRDHGQEIDF